jgi:carboxymethylenebutenolidase
MAIDGKMVTFAANGGTADGYLAEPETPGRHRAVVVVQEWWGLDDHIKDLCRRLASEGYVALAPDHYHGRVAEEPSDAMKLAMELDLDQATAEMRGAVNFLKARDDVGAVGIVGFCMGGRLSFLAACRIPQLDAAIVFYGRGPDDESEIRNITAPVLGLYAEDDPNITPKVPAVSAAMAAAGKSFTYHIYPGTHHAFFNDTRPQIYNREAADDAWKWSLRFFRQHLAA